MAVLSEKPLALNLAQAAKLVSTAARCRRLLMVSQTRRYEPGLELLRKAGARLGRLGLVTVQFSRPHRAPGYREVMDDPLLVDMAPHAFDAVRYVTGADPVAVYCDAFNPAWSWYSGCAAAVGIFEMAGGLRFSYTASWCSPGLPTSWAGHWRLSGELGLVEWNGVEAPRISLDEDVDGPVPADPSEAGPVDPTEQVDGALTDFVAALRTGAVPWGEASDNLLTMAMVQAAVTSGRTRTKVDIGELLATARAGELCG